MKIIGSKTKYTEVAIVYVQTRNTVPFRSLYSTSAISSLEVALYLLQPDLLEQFNVMLHRIISLFLNRRT